MDALPYDLLGPDSEAHQLAIQKAKEIVGQLKKAIDCLTSAADDSQPPPLRGGYLRAGDQYLDTIIHCAEAAKMQLRVAHSASYDKPKVVA